MSRCTLDSGKYEVAIGWDNPLQTFFLQVFERGAATPLIEEGTTHNACIDPAELVALAEQYGCSFDKDRLINELKLDQLHNRARGYSMASSEVKPIIGREELCPHCKSELNPGATTCHMCGAYKVYLKGSVLAPMIFLGIFVVTIAILFDSPAMLLLLLLIFAVYAGIKKRHTEYQGWAPRSSEQ